MKVSKLLILIIALINGQLNAQKTLNQNIKDSALYLKTEKVQQIILRFPKNYKTGHSYPLLVFLHGNGGTAQSSTLFFQNYSNSEIIMAFPEGQYPKLVNGAIGYSWYLETKDKSVWEIADNYSVENIAAYIKVINSTYKIGKVYVFGFSQGASLAYMTGFKYPELVNGVISVGGILPEIDKFGSVVSSKDLENAKQLKFFISRGKKDNLIKKKQFVYQEKFLNENEFDVLSIEYDGGHFLTEELIDEILDWIGSKPKK